MLRSEVEAPFYYLRSTDAYALSQCKGKIVMIYGYLGYWMYQDILENGAVGFITYDGNANYADRDIDQRELRSYVHKGSKLPGVNINAKDAIALIASGAQQAKIVLGEELGLDRNVIVRYWDWLTGFVTGDMGRSYSYAMDVSGVLSGKVAVARETVPPLISQPRLLIFSNT